MANTGIILRKNTKAVLIENPPEIGEIVFAEDTNEIGSMSNGVLIWQLWDITPASQYAYKDDERPERTSIEQADRLMYLDDQDNIIREFVRNGGEWEELHFGMDSVWVHSNIEPKFHTVEDFPYLGKYDYSMKTGYSPSSSHDVVTKEYVTSSGVSEIIKLDGSNEFDVGYVPSADDDIVTLGHLLGGDALYTIPSVKGPVGSLWNDGGTFRISEPRLFTGLFYRRYNDSSDILMDEVDDFLFVYDTNDTEIYSSAIVNGVVPPFSPPDDFYVLVRISRSCPTPHPNDTYVKVDVLDDPANGWSYMRKDFTIADDVSENQKVHHFDCI